ncbi:MAG: protein TolR [Alphaproteobacteria bacterium]|jgi:biopolymer transport protein TolR|nr:protein TolR [Alphaproteobacteria bacterium]|tara:strand:- start:85 stop:543 length:459 start_codon:yes stop_codon:yes gene_type:complete
MTVRVTGGGHFGKGRNGVSRYRPMSEINVTPFVDVMLVLLIVFMITAPLLTVGVPVDLPKTRAASLTNSDEPLVITIDDQGAIFIEELTITIENLVPRLVAVTGANPDARIFVRGDKAIDYGRVMQVMGAVSAAGFNKVSLLAELPRGRKKK